MKRAREDKMIEAMANLAMAAQALRDEVSRLRKENEDLSGAIETLQGVFGAEHREMLEEAERQEKEFQEGLSAILSFVPGGGEGKK